VWSGTHTTHIWSLVQQCTHTHFVSELVPAVGVNIQVVLSEVRPIFRSARSQPYHHRTIVAAVVAPIHTTPPTRASSTMGASRMAWRTTG
jgi:hypothetical protein